LVADIDARNIAVEQAGISTAEFLRRRLRLSPSEAKSRVSAARELIESVSPSGEAIPAPLPRTAEAVADGVVSLEQVRVISRALQKLPTGLDPELRVEAEAQLAEHARSLDPAQLAVVGRRIHTILDPDGALDGASWRSSATPAAAT
jgi:mRNA-degrading endonuclease toxin of MazEF toxin-antitoxin module